MLLANVVKSGRCLMTFIYMPAKHVTSRSELAGDERMMAARARTGHDTIYED